MINPFKEINWQPGSTDLHKFARSLVIGFPVIAVVFFLAKWFKTHQQPDPAFFLKLGVIGAAVGVVCWLVPAIARPLYYAWYALAACIGIVMANLLFALLFYGLFAPLGLIMRLIGRDPLNLHWQKRTVTTHWIDAEPSPPPSRYFRQF
jgi:hypothetical protein